MTGNALTPRSAAARQQTRDWLAQRRAERRNRLTRRREAAAAMVPDAHAACGPVNPAAPADTAGSVTAPGPAGADPAPDEAPQQSGSSQHSSEPKTAGPSSLVVTDAPLTDMPEIGPGLRCHLEAAGIGSIGDLAAYDATSLCRALPRFADLFNLEWIIAQARARLITG